MKTVTVYSTTYCSYCVAAKKLLSDNNVPYEEKDVTNDQEKRVWLVQKTGQRTVPQIFFGDTPIGGYTELSQIVHQGKLQELLK